MYNLTTPMTLTETAQLTKRVLLISLVLLVIAISGWISYQVWYYKYYLPNKPAVEVLPEVKFGILPRPVLPKSEISSSNYSYSLDTETGDVPTTLPKIAKVFFVPQLGTTLLSSNRATNLAEKLGFTQGPENISST